MFAIDQFKIGDYLVVIVNIALKKKLLNFMANKNTPLLGTLRKSKFEVTSVSFLQ